MDYKWKFPEKQNVEEHIIKHIFESENEKPLWRDYFGIDRYNEYTKYGSKIISKDLFNSYYNASISNINKSDYHYIYKSYKNYSCNCLDKSNNLTTCLQLSFNKYGFVSDNLHITSCFFKNNIYLNSSIMYAVRYFIKNKPKNERFVIKGLKVNSTLFRNALTETIRFDTNKSKNIDFIRMFLLTYIKNIINLDESELNYYIVLLPLLNNKLIDYKLQLIINKIYDINIINEYIKYFESSIYEINKLLSLSKDYTYDSLEIENEKVFLDLCLCACNKIKYKIDKDSYKYTFVTDFGKSLVQMGLFID